MFLASLLALTVAGSVVAEVPPVQDGTEWKTNNGDLSISNIGSYTIKGATSSLQAEFRGSPLRGRSVFQNFEFTASSLTGNLKQVDRTRWYLADGQISGSVVMTQVADEETFTLRTNTVNLKENPAQTELSFGIPGRLELDSNLGRSVRAGTGTVLFDTVGEERQLTKLTLGSGYTASGSSVDDSTRVKSDYTVVGNSATLTTLATTEQFVSPGKLDLTIDQSGGRAGQNSQYNEKKLDFKSSGGTIVFPKAGAAGRPIRSADLNGRITGVVDTWVQIEGDEDEAPTWEKFKVTVSGDRLTFSEAGVLRLAGNVQFRIDGLQGFTGSGNELLVRFDAQMNVLSWETRGGPGTIQELKDGDGGLNRR